ncbi:MAG: hypothetical protein GY772_28860, partial [bacterium]|nr:hypothetical protein [bacterium]
PIACLVDEMQAAEPEQVLASNSAETLGAFIFLGDEDQAISHNYFPAYTRVPWV